MAIQTIKYIQQIKKKKTIDFRNEKCLLFISRLYLHYIKIIKFISIYSITNYKVNSTITIKIQQSIQLLWQYKQ
jgi:hypothetical protein